MTKPTSTFSYNGFTIPSAIVFNDSSSSLQSGLEEQVTICFQTRMSNDANKIEINVAHKYIICELLFCMQESIIIEHLVSMDALNVFLRKQQKKWTCILLKLRLFHIHSSPWHVSKLVNHYQSKFTFQKLRGGIHQMMLVQMWIKFYLTLFVPVVQVVASRLAEDAAISIS